MNRHEMRKYRAQMRAKGLVSVRRKLDNGTFERVWIKKHDAVQDLKGAWHQKIEYCMNVLGPDLVTKLIRDEVFNGREPAPTDWVKIAADKARAARYRTTLDAMVVQAKDFESYPAKTEGARI